MSTIDTVPLTPTWTSNPLPINGKTFYVWTIGCQMNEADSARISTMLQEAGYRSVSDESDADIVVLNSCVVRQAAEDKVSGRLNSLIREKRRRPEMSVVLTGCIVTNQHDALRERFPHVDLFFDPSDFDALQEFVPEMGEFGDDLAELPHYYTESVGAAGVSAHVPIIYGCNFLCSYCIVPYRRGKERSRPVDDIVREVERITAGGVRDITLLGQTVNAYGHDLPDETGLAELLQIVDQRTNIERLRFLTSHPKYMSDEILQTMADSASVCEHLNLPVQAGNDEVLRRMRRTYSVDLWRDRIAAARRLMHGLTVATDIIVGFPGETDEQFADTLSILEEARLEKVHVAMYSPRPGTLSARWEDDVPDSVKHERHQAVERLQERVCTEINRMRVGEVVEVLVDSRNKGRWGGRTRGNTLVHFADDRELLGAMVDVRITESSPWYLKGEPAGNPR